jgi:hypothetical protein
MISQTILSHVRSQVSLALGLTLLTLAGCSRTPANFHANLIPADGPLKYKGEPVAGAQLTFVGDESIEPGLAVTDSKGRFKCITNDSTEGMRAGDYVVVVAHPSRQIAKIYSSAETSPLQVSLSEDGENHFALELTD